MATNTRAELTTEFSTLLNGAQPKVSKAALLASVQKLLDSYLNQRSDTWLPPVKRQQNPPPASPASGDRYVVGPGPSGAWAGHDEEIAEWDGTAWVFSTVGNGAMVFALDLPAVCYMKSQGAFSARPVPRAFLQGMAGTSSTSNVALQQVASLSGPLQTGRRYRVEVCMLVQSETLTQGIKVGLSGPVAADLAWTVRIPDAVNGSKEEHGNDYNVAVTTTAVPAVDKTFRVHIAAEVVAPTYDDYIYAMIATTDAGTQVDVMPGSWIEITDTTN